MRKYVRQNKLNENSKRKSKSYDVRILLHRYTPKQKSENNTRLKTRLLNKESNLRSFESIILIPKFTTNRLVER